MVWNTPTLCQKYACKYFSFFDCGKIHISITFTIFKCELIILGATKYYQVECEDAVPPSGVTWEKHTKLTHTLSAFSLPFTLVQFKYISHSWACIFFLMKALNVASSTWVYLLVLRIQDSGKEESLKLVKEKLVKTRDRECRESKASRGTHVEMHPRPHWRTERKGNGTHETHHSLSKGLKACAMIEEKAVMLKTVEDHFCGIWSYLEPHK